MPLSEPLEELPKLYLFNVLRTCARNALRLGRVVDSRNLLPLQLVGFSSWSSENQIS